MRPENPYKKQIRNGVVWNKEVIEAFEAGADAYDAGLKNGVELEDDWYIDEDGNKHTRRGYLVFIPEGNESPHKHVDGIVEDYPPEEGWIISLRLKLSVIKRGYSDRHNRA